MRAWPAPCWQWRRPWGTKSVFVLEVTKREVRTELEVSSILSPRASLAALARVPSEASESLATCLLASFEVPDTVSLTLSLTKLAAPL